MKKDYSALSFSEKERICESIFIANGPYWHVYTDGTKMQNIFCSEDEFKSGMWCLAAALNLSKDVKALTFELMINHIHLILAGKREDCIKAFNLFEARLKKAFPIREHTIDWSQFKMDILPIENLQALRNEIIYTNRNAEAFSQIASRLKDTIFLTDDELYSAMLSFINKEYSVRTATELSTQQKVDTARHLHFNYNASNQQLRSMLRMDLAILEELFP